MKPLELLIAVFIYGLMGAGVIWALCAVLLRNLFHSALALAAVLISVAGIYIALHAEFLAVVQILIYVGAVMTMVIFAIMLTQRLSDPAVRSHNNQKWIAAVGTALFLGILIRVIQVTPWPVRGVPDPIFTQENVRVIGQSLLSVYVFPFEVLAVILTAVVIGAVIIAKRESNS